MALLNRFSKLNDRGETGIFTFIVTKSVTRDFHRDATTKDFCFGYHRWAISFQRPTEKVLGVHLLLRNPSPNSSCLVDFTLTLLNREHFSQNEVYTKKQAKFTITNSMQGVARWIQMSDLIDRHFSDETGEFLFELSLSNMTTIFECDIQLSPNILTQYKSMLHEHPSSQHHHQMQILANNNNSNNNTNTSNNNNNGDQQPLKSDSSSRHSSSSSRQPTSANSNNNNNNNNNNSNSNNTRKNSELINLETNYFTFGAFDWSLTIVPLVIPSQQHPVAAAAAAPLSPQQASSKENTSASTVSNSSSNNTTTTTGSSAASGCNLLTPNKSQLSNSSLLSIASNGSNGHHHHHHQVNNASKKGQLQQQQQLPAAPMEPVCRVYLNRLNGFDCLCRVKYRVILGHHQAGSPHPAEFVDSRLLDQISDSGGRIRGHQFRNTNILKLISLRSGQQQQQQQQQQPLMPSTFKHQQSNQQQQQHQNLAASLDLRVHIEMFCANTVSEAQCSIQRKPNEVGQVSNCSDRNKQAWCVESDTDNENIRLKLFFLDLQSVPRNHIRYISWIAYIVRRDSKSGLMKESIAARNSPHSNYYLQDGIDMGTLMDTDIKTKELNNSPKAFLDGNQLTVHIEWVDSLLLFSHLYNNYDSLATIQRHQMRRELSALQQEFELLERKYLQNRRAMNQLLDSGAGGTNQMVDQQQQQQQSNAAASIAPANHNSNNNTSAGQPARNQSSAGSRKVSLAISELSVASGQWAPGSQPDGSMVVPMVAAAASAVAIGQQMILGSGPVGCQSRRTPPMSHDERLKFSSSTPPGRSHQPIDHHHHQHHHQHNQQQQHHHQAVGQRLSDSPTHQKLLEQMKLGGGGTGSGSAAVAAVAARRRLPQQPALGKIQAQELRQMITSADLLASGSYYQPQQPQPQQQRGFTGSLESCPASGGATMQPVQHDPSPPSGGHLMFGSPVKQQQLCSQAQQAAAVAAAGGQLVDMVMQIGESTIGQQSYRGHHQHRAAHQRASLAPELEASAHLQHQQQHHRQSLPHQHNLPSSSLHHPLQLAGSSSSSNAQQLLDQSSGGGGGGSATAAAAAAAAAATATITAQLLANQAECDQVDRYYHHAPMARMDSYGRHNRPSPSSQNTTTAQQQQQQQQTGTAAAGTPSPLVASYERLMLARPSSSMTSASASDQQQQQQPLGQPNNIDLEMEMEALYVAAASAGDQQQACLGLGPGGGQPAPQQDQASVDELVLEARRESAEASQHYHQHHHHHQQVVDAIARHQAASFATDHQFDGLGHYEDTI